MIFNYLYIFCLLFEFYSTNYIRQLNFTIVMENIEGIIEVDGQNRNTLIENKLGLHIGNICRIQISYVLYEGAIECFTAKAGQQEIKLCTVNLRNGFVFDVRYLGTEFEKIIPFLHEKVKYGSAGTLTSYREL